MRVLNVLIQVVCGQQLPWHPVHGHTLNAASPTKNPVVKAAVNAEEDQTAVETP